jgi:hypothetical protein
MAWHKKHDTTRCLVFKCILFYYSGHEVIYTNPIAVWAELNVSCITQWPWIIFFRSYLAPIFEWILNSSSTTPEIKES